MSYCNYNLPNFLQQYFLILRLLEIKNTVQLFLISRLQSSLTPKPPKRSNKTQAFTSGYRLDGEYFFDERVILSSSIPSNIFHSFRIVIDKASVQSTKVFLDETRWLKGVIDLFMLNYYEDIISNSGFQKIFNS